MTPRIYRVRGTKELGYTIAIPSQAKQGEEYKCYIASEQAGNMHPPGTLIYIPVKP